MCSAPLRPRYRTTSNVLKLGNVESPKADGWQVHLGMCPEQQLDGATETGPAENSDGTDEPQARQGARVQGHGATVPQGGPHSQARCRGEPGGGFPL